MKEKGNEREIFIVYEPSFAKNSKYENLNRSTMRIHLEISPNTEPVPFEYQQKLVGTIHKWIGKNSIHDNISLYSFSWLNGGRMKDNALEFQNGANMFISFYDEHIVKQIIKAILDEPEMFCGLVVSGINIDRNPQLDDRELFNCASPIFIKRKLADGRIKQYSFSDAEASQYLKETLLSKMREVGLEDDTLDIRFDTSYNKKKVKLVRYHGIGNKACLCPVIIKAKPETKLFAWNVGIGNCTGIGFGAIY